MKILLLIIIAIIAWPIALAIIAFEALFWLFILFIWMLPVPLRDRGHRR